MPVLPNSTNQLQLMELSKFIKDKIKAWEGCELTAYRCAAGVLTIGYGHTGPDVKPGMRITQDKANELFEADIRRFAASVEPLLAGITLNNAQFDALVSLAYNIGPGRLAGSTLLRKVKANPADPGIRSEFLRFVYAGGKVLSGLVKRRDAEAKHYFDGQ